VRSTTSSLAERRAAGFSIRRLWPLAVLALALAAFFGLGLNRYLTFDALRENRALLTAFVADHALLASVLFVLAYAAVVAMSVPGGAVLTIAGGFLFGAILGTALAVIAATIGATLVFLIARTAFGEPLRARAGPFLKRMEAGFRENALSYLLVLRLIPLFPFFVVNLVPAFLGVSLRTFVTGTFMGIIPGTFVYASVGAGLGSVFDRSEEFSPASVLTPEIVTALIGLAVLALLPVVYRKIKARRTPTV
jgi:uncharacterized membrane protein YdjX (TVP38/TMEM64 family)